MLCVVRNQDLNEEENFISSSAHPEDIYSTCALARIHPVYLYKTVTSSSMSMACESSRNPCHFTLDVISSIKKNTNFTGDGVIQNTISMDITDSH